MSDSSSDTSSSDDSRSGSYDSSSDSSPVTPKRPRRTSTPTTTIPSSSTQENKKPTATLTDLDVTDCSVCFDTLKAPISQCDNGHVVCGTCCRKLKKKCATCTLPMDSRNRAMERVIELLRFPCPNFEFGCSEDLSFSEKSRHLEQCAFAECFCPFTGCGFSGSYKVLYEHCLDTHKRSLRIFECGSDHVFVQLKDGEKAVIMEETTEGGSGGGRGGELVVVECFDRPYARLISVSNIAPNAPGIRRLSYNLRLHSSHSDRLSFESNVNRVLKVSGEIPTKHYTMIPLYVLPDYKLEISIKRKSY